ncbi:MAG: DUF2160 domain-containing protein [Roseinatronobacter sp.]
MTDITHTPRRAPWGLIYATAATVMGGALAGLFWIAPRKSDAIDWTGQIVPGFWMAWTLPVALFFWCIATLLVTFSLLAIRFPETPRIGVLRLETTRGDRLFISLLGSAFICLIWLFFAGPPLWGALAVCFFYAGAVFRWV